MITLSIISIFLPIVMGIILSLLKNIKRNNKLLLVLISLIIETILVLFLVNSNDVVYTLFKMNDLLTIEIKIDALSKLFMLIDSIGFLIVSIFSFKYTSNEESHGSFKEEMFYSFYLLALGALIGMAQSSNLISMYFFFELTTLMSMPLVLFERTKEAISGALKYLFYSMGGAFLALGMLFVLGKYANSYSFVEGGNLNLTLVAGHENLILGFVLAGIIGFGAKAGMYPLHAWLPTAHPVAPAPASALLSGIIAKSGVLAIIRVIYYFVGTQFISNTFVQTTLLILSLITILMGSMMAYKENILKKRLAYSSVSQISYILFGVFLLNEIALKGAIMQILFHSVVKICLFLFSGSIIFITGKHNVDELKGLGRKMPKTFVAFTLASLSLIGIPPFAGFISKWYLAQGSLSSGIEVIDYLGPVILLISALLTAGYLLPISINGFWPGKEYNDINEYNDGSKMMYIPLLVLAIFSLLLGLLSGIYSPLINSIITNLF